VWKKHITSSKRIPKINALKIIQAKLFKCMVCKRKNETTYAIWHNFFIGVINENSNRIKKRIMSAGNENRKREIPHQSLKLQTTGKSGKKKMEEEETESGKDAVILSGSIDALPPKGQLEVLFMDGIKDILCAEKQIEKMLLKMGAEATSEELRQSFKDHRLETEDHISRLEEIVEMLSEKVTTIKCESVKGLSDELDRMISETRKNTFTRDAALILGGLKVEHYEIATYTGLIQLAKALGKKEIAELLTDTLEEEKDAAGQISSVAEDVVYEHAIID
jgi:ferritin-like metal-binding protein YciE